MDIKKIIEEDNKVTANNETIKKMQQNIINGYENSISLEESLSNKLAIDRSYRDEVHQFFRENNFQKSDTNHNGNIVAESNPTTYYRCQNTWATVLFSKYSETEDKIQITFPLSGIYNNLSYKLENDAMKILEFPNGFRLNNETLYIGNYKKIISNCDSIDELSNLDKQIKDRIEYLQLNINKDINTNSLYELQNGNQFTTFAEAFGAL